MVEVAITDWLMALLVLGVAIKLAFDLVATPQDAFSLGGGRAH